ncbi:MAG: AraC family transcriptional regulator [Acutalibacteraceae bacterium]
MLKLKKYNVIIALKVGENVICKEIIDALSPITDEEKQLLQGKSFDRSIYMSGKHNVINSKKLLADGKLITVRKHSRFVDFPAHTHDYIEVVYMCSGKTTHIINGEKLILNTGELLFLNQNVKQEILRADKNDIAVNFIILPEFFDQMIHMLGDEETPLRKFIVDSLLNGNSNSAFLHFKVADILPIQNLIENLIFTLIHNTPNKRKINQTTMGLLFMQLMNYTDRLYSQNAEQEAVIQVLNYIESHYANGSLTEIAEKLHYDIYWLSREIKKKTGKTYVELLQEKRLAKAAFLLKNTNAKISDIAETVGYENLSYFHRIFNKKFGKTPREYRNCK